MATKKSVITPLMDYVLATQAEAESKTASGLYLPDKATEKPKIATVEEIGEGVRFVRRGDKIVYKSYATTELQVDGKDYLLIREEDILATLN